MPSENSTVDAPPPALLRWSERAWRIAGILILFILALDAVAWLGLKLADHREVLSVDPNLIYPGESWAPQMLEETGRLEVAWSPYCYWRVVPFSGRYVTVDPNGLRRTWNGGAPRITGVNVRVHRILMFGGSAMFGIDARDDYTIPSLFAKDLQRAEIPNVEVINYGQIGYVSTQELINFLLALRADERPDLVVFYDGFDDANAAYRDKAAGMTAGESQRAREFNLLDRRLASRRRSLYRAAGGTMLAASSLGVVLEAILRHYAAGFHRNPGKSPEIGRQLSRLMNSRLAEAVVDVYLKNLRMADATAAGLGIPIIFYWQPALAVKSPRSAFESRLSQESSGKAPGREQFVRDVYSDLHATLTMPMYRGPRITDLSTILNGKPSCFVDDADIVEACNAVIASRIAADAIPILRELAARERLAPRLLQSPGP